jgi:hypothetical protein
MGASAAMMDTRREFHDAQQDADAGERLKKHGRFARHRLSGLAHSVLFDKINFD